MARPLRFALAALCLGLSACSSSAPGTRRVPEGAALLFDVDFSAPEQTVGSEVKFVEAGTVQPFPSKIPSGIFFGHPTVVAKLCGLDDQPLQLSVATGDQSIEGVEFLFDQRYGRYHVELDLCIDKLDPPPLPSQAMQVAVFLDISQAHALGFESGGDIVMIDPNLQPETIEKPRQVGKFELGKPMHLLFDVDLEKQTLLISVDGKTVYEGPVQADIPRASRVVVRGSPTTVAAFDNFWVWAEHDLTPPGTTLSPPIAGPEIPPVVDEPKK